MGLIDAARTFTRTSPAFGSGVGSSPTRMTSGVPVVSKNAAFMSSLDFGIGIGNTDAKWRTGKQIRLSLHDRINGTVAAVTRFRRSSSPDRRTGREAFR